MTSSENLNNKKKILFAITKGNFGGAQRYVFDLATSLPQDQFEVLVTCGEGELLKNKLREKNIKVIDLKSSQRDINTKKDIGTFLEIRRIILEEKPDVLHLNSSKIGGVGALAGRLCGVKKIIFTSHGWAFNENRGLLSKYLILFLHWLTIMLSHTTITVSHKAKRDIVWLPFIKNKIKVVHNGISDFETIERNEARKILTDENNQNKKIIFSLAELHNNKGIDIALKAISMLPQEIKNDLLFCVAGEGEEEENLINLIKKLELENSVILLGYIENGKKLLVGADIFLLSSRTEAFPYVILEAGIKSLPIISTCVGGIPEIIQNMENGILVHPKNPKEIAEAISYLREHPDYEEKFKKEIKKTITNFFSLDKMLDETIRIYN